MGSVFNHSLLLCSLLFVFLFLHTAAYCHDTQEWIETICRQMEAFGFCNNTFNENLRSPCMDIVGLTQLTIELTTRNATNIHDFSLSLLIDASDARDLQILKECANDYQLVVKAFDQASKDFFAENYGNMIAHELTAPKPVSICQSSLSFRSSPTHALNVLIEWTTELRILIAMSIVTGHYLTITGCYC